MSGKRRPSLSYTAGRHGHQVRVFERPGRTTLYLSVWHPEAQGGRGGEAKRSLGHADRERAKDYADDLAGKLRRGEEELRAAEPEGAAVRRIFRLCRRQRTPDKGVLPGRRRASGRALDQRSRRRRVRPPV